MKRFLTRTCLLFFVSTFAFAQERRIDIHNQDIFFLDSGKLILQNLTARVVNPNDLINEPKHGLHSTGVKLTFQVVALGFADSLAISSKKDDGTITEIKMSSLVPNQVTSGQTTDKLIEYRWQPNFLFSLDMGESKTFVLRLNDTYQISVLATRRFGQLPNGSRGNYLDFDTKTLTIRKLN